MALTVKSRKALRTGRVTASQANRIARHFGVTLDLSNDIELAGKWKHGWIPLDAVAAAVKAKRYHGGPDGREVRGKGRGGSLVESMRRPSGGRSKGAPPAAKVTHERYGDNLYRVSKPAGSDGLASYRLVNGRSHAEGAGPRRESHISAESLQDGRTKLTDSRTGESVKAVHLASFHDQGHTITGVRGGLMHTRDDSGKSHVYDPATGRAAVSPATRRAQEVAQDRTRRLHNAQVAEDERLIGSKGITSAPDSVLKGLVDISGNPAVTKAARHELGQRGYKEVRPGKWQKQ